jgi:hypothetical protein
MFPGEVSEQKCRGDTFWTSPLEVPTVGLCVRGRPVSRGDEVTEPTSPIKFSLVGARDMYSALLWPYELRALGTPGGLDVGTHGGDTARVS